MFRFPVAFRPPAFASWASCSRQGVGPPLRLAYRCWHRASPRPCRTLTGFPCSARVRHGWGWVPSIPRGRRCPHGRECSTTAACRITAACPCLSGTANPARTVMLTRHPQGFPDSHPIPRLPLACGPWAGAGTLGLSRELRTRPLPATHVTGGDRSQDTDPKSRRRHCRPPLDGLTHHERPHVASITHTSRSCDVRSPGLLRPVDGFPVLLGRS